MERLFALPLGFTFFHEGLHAFLLIFRVEQIIEDLFLLGESVFEEGVVRVVDQPLRGVNSQRGA